MRGFVTPPPPLRVSCFRSATSWTIKLLYYGTKLLYRPCLVRSATSCSGSATSWNTRLIYYYPTNLPYCCTKLLYHPHSPRSETSWTIKLLYYPTTVLNYYTALTLPGAGRAAAAGRRARPTDPEGGARGARAGEDPRPSLRQERRVQPSLVVQGLLRADTTSPNLPSPALSRTLSLTLALSPLSFPTLALSLSRSSPPSGTRPPSSPWGRGRPPLSRRSCWRSSTAQPSPSTAPTDCSSRSSKRSKRVVV